MNIVKILLVLGLGYVAMTQKSEKTRNMLLVVTGLLAFCMFSVEGFIIESSTVLSDIFSSSSPLGSLSADPDNTIEVTGSENRYTFRGPLAGTVTIDGTVPISPDNVTCKIGVVTSMDAVGTVGYKDGVTWTDYTDDPGAPVQIDDLLTCYNPCPTAEPPTNQCGAGYQYKATTGVTYTGAVGDSDYVSKCCEAAPNETCAAGKTRLRDTATCPSTHTDKAGASCGSATCSTDDFTASGACCELPCSDENCSVFNSGENTKCGEYEFLGLFPFDQYCK